MIRHTVNDSGSAAIKVIAFVAVSLLLFGLLVVAGIAGMSASIQSRCNTSQALVAPAVITISPEGTITIGDVTLDEEQQANQRLAVGIAVARGLTPWQTALTLGVMHQESRSRNISYGDRDSLGLFQQRPSVKVWGTATQIMDPVHSINKFIDAMLAANVTGGSLMEAGIKIQRPNPFYYRRDWEWDVMATEMATRLLASTDPSAAQPVIQAKESACLRIAPEVDAIPASAGGWQQPLRGNFRMSSGFGYRIHPITGVRKLHGGTDFAAPSGTPVYATKAGVITTRGWEGSYGNYVKITHGGDTASGYAHLSRFADGAGFGSTVSAGQLIGYVGNTGGSTGAHLHFEIFINGERVDAIPYLRGS